MGFLFKFLTWPLLSDRRRCVLILNEDYPGEEG